MRNLIFTIFFSAATALSAQDSVLTVMTFNIRYDNPADGENNWHVRNQDIVRFLQDQHPDMFGIQEGLLHQVHYIDSALSAYAFIGVGRDDGKQTGEFSALFYDTTRFVVTVSGTYWLSPTPDTPSIGWDAALPRICTYARLQDIHTREQFWAFNTHFDHIGKTARMNAALNSMHAIFNVWNTEGLPVIFMGDLNAETDEESYRNITAVMQDSRSSATSKHGPEGTFNGFVPDAKDMKRIDYIFTYHCSVLEQWHIEDRRPDGRWLSDHLPVRADVQLK